MPIYDFRCRGCGAEFERLVMGRGAGTCPRCGGKRLERLPSRFALRGSRGFSGSAGTACGPCIVLKRELRAWLEAIKQHLESEHQETFGGSVVPLGIMQAAPE